MTAALAPCTADVDDVRRSIVERGYAFVPGLLPEREVRGVGAEMAAALATTGWVEPGTLRAAGPPVDGSPEHAAVLTAVQRVEGFHRLAHHPVLLDLVAGVLGMEIFVHPGKVARLLAPAASGQVPTVSHQDAALLHVSGDLVTAWVPFVDCPVERGGLKLLEGSHLGGFRIPDANIHLHVPDDDPQWRTAVYRPGDVVLFHVLTVHAGMPNLTDEVRLSGDYRYQPLADPIQPGPTVPNRHPLTPSWDEITKGWTTTRWVDLAAGVTIRRPHAEGTTLQQAITRGGEVLPPSRLLASATP